RLGFGRPDGLPAGGYPDLGRRTVHGDGGDSLADRGAGPELSPRWLRGGFPRDRRNTAPRASSRHRRGVRGTPRGGYGAVSHVIDATRLAELRAVTDEFVERSRAVTKSDALFDLDPRHTAARPVLRRIKNPADNDPVYRWVAFESPIPDIVAQLLGPDV